MKVFNLSKPYLYKHKARFILYLILSVGGGAFAIITPYLIGGFIDSLVAGNSMQTVFRFCGIFAAISVTKILLNYLTSMLYIKMQMIMGYEFNQDIITHIQKLSVSYVENNDTSFLCQVANGDCNSIIIFCITFFQNFILNSVFIVVTPVILFRLNAVVTLILIIFAAAYIVLYAMFKKPLFNINMLLKNTQNSFFSKLLEQLKFSKYIKIHEAAEVFYKRVEKSFNQLLTAAVKNQKISFLYSGLEGIVSLVTQTVLFLMGGYLIIMGNFTIGMFTIFSSYFNILLGSARYFFNLGKSYQETLVSYNRLQDILNEKTEIAGSKKLTVIDSIEAKSLCFFYGGNSIFYNHNFSFKKGNIYGIVGRNGAGKTTLINLLMGLYLYEKQGSIKYGNENLNDLDLHFLRERQIGVAEQSPILISDTIRSNLLIESNNNVSDENIFFYLDLLNCANYINGLENGLETVVNETATNLSGGEKQKLSLIRVLLKNPMLMIFDEPTSALDFNSTCAFMEYLNAIKTEKIIILITHDQYVRQKCDVVIDMDKKELLEPYHLKTNNLVLKS